MTVRVCMREGIFANAMNVKERSRYIYKGMTYGMRGEGSSVRDIDGDGERE